MSAARIGLTGGIGSGKSGIARLFMRRGVMTLDADDIARELSRPGQLPYRDIVARFGKAILLRDGQINRKALGKIIFDDPQAKSHLEAILHPAIRQAMQAWVKTCPGSYCILEIPLLFETQNRIRVDRKLAVICDKDIRRQRLVASRDRSHEHIEKIMATQLTDEQRKDLADDIIDNSEDRETSARAVDQLKKKYDRLFGQ